MPVVRDAYRRAAREHHPDRRGGTGGRMSEINLAWDTLSDPRRRREYDLSLRLPSSPGPYRDAAPAAPMEPRWNPLARYQEPPRFPWRLMAALAALGAVAVVVGTATASTPPPPTVDNVLVDGDCVVIEPNGDAAERLCTESNDGVVVAFLAVPGDCPAGSEPHRDRQGLGTACVRRP